MAEDDDRIMAVDAPLSSPPQSYGGGYRRGKAAETTSSQKRS
jgi:hypothetical protein